MRGIRAFLTFAALFLVWGPGVSPAFADGFVGAESEINPDIFRIDQAKYLGAKPDSDIQLKDETGRILTLGEVRAGLPTILVLSYYNCDGACSLINGDLAALIEKETAYKIGRDFKVVTVSFDPNDNPETLAGFRKRFAMPDGAENGGWTLALPATEHDLHRLADTVGFKFFWSIQDRTFFHPGVYMFLSPEGSVVRYLYSHDARPKDLELALADARRGIAETTTSRLYHQAVGLCYSFNYKDGRYRLNIPVFIGAGSAMIGVLTFVISVLVYRRREKGGVAL